MQDFKTLSGTPPCRSKRFISPDQKGAESTTEKPLPGEVQHDQNLSHEKPKTLNPFP